MHNAALKILKALEKNGELTLEEISALIPQRQGDHRDFYVFASLVAIGYVDDDKLPDPNEPNPKNRKEGLLAREYFASHDAEQTASYDNWTWQRVGETALREQPFSLTGKGSLFLSEYRSKRFERLFSLGTGILVGIVVAVVGAYVRAELGKV
ncbi:MAG: hypothetical protein CME36_00725 [unclassified Hahellaceae]|nr:hypothetical protein [Hahellaceae bacterium]|tara:strand:- start:5922 stop:6380 length:459 start_codon:yes stop_codon:yes gene_type:complete